MKDKDFVSCGGILFTAAAIVFAITLISLGMTDAKYDEYTFKMWEVMDDIHDMDKSFMEKSRDCLDSQYADVEACTQADFFAEALWQKQLKWMELSTIRGQTSP